MQSMTSLGIGGPGLVMRPLLKNFLEPDRSGVDPSTLKFFCFHMFIYNEIKKAKKTIDTSINMIQIMVTMT